MPLLVTRELAQRLEGAELAAAEAAVAALPGRAESIAVAGGTAMFLGSGSPLTQALHLGMRGAVGGHEIDFLEAFFARRRSAVAISVCPHADPTLFNALDKRGYRIAHFENTLARPLRAHDWFGADSAIRAAGPDDRDEFCQTVTRGFSDDGSFTPQVLDIALNLYGAGGAVSYLATHDGFPAAGGILRTSSGVGLMYCDATMAKFRGNGLQAALIRTRLRKAAESGCDVAMACTMPGTVSQRNYERAGFQVAYTKAMLVKDWS